MGSASRSSAGAAKKCTGTGARALKALTYVLVWLIVPLMIGLVIYTFGPRTVFTWHPVCMMTAFLFFVTHGVLSYRSSYVPSASLTTKRRVHGFLQYTGAFFALLGVVIIVTEKVNSGSSIALENAHEYFGVITLTLMLAQVIAGIVKYALLPARVKVLIVHGWLGIVVYLCALTTVCLGLFVALGTSPHAYVAYIGYSLVATLALVVLLNRILLPLPRDERAQPQQSQFDSYQSSALVNAVAEHYQS